MNNAIFSQATDADFLDDISYKFLIEPNNDFNINSQTGALTTARQLDFETQSSYTFVVTTVDGQATASNSPSSPARARVDITVIVSRNHKKSSRENMFKKRQKCQNPVKYLRY